MHKIAFYSILLALPFSAMGGSDTYIIDSTHTYPYFKVSHLGFSTLQGRFNKTTGSLKIDIAAKIASVDIIIDAASIDTAMAKRDKHLRGPDFLNTAEFPEITYKSTKIKFKGDTMATVEGKLTMMGVTKPVTLKVTHIKCGVNPLNKKQVCGFDAEGKLKRSDYGMKYGLPAIGDEMTLSFEVEAVKQ